MRGQMVDPRADDIRPYGAYRLWFFVGAAVPSGPGHTLGKRSEFVRRGHELGAAASSARCRSHLSISRFPSFSPRASHMPCLFDSVGFVSRSM